MGNLQSLEFILRAYLYNIVSKRMNKIDFYSLQIGLEIEEDEFTNYDSLGKLINKFNEQMKNEKSKEIDKSIVEVRDALAHGRIASLDSSSRPHLIKYSRPNNGKVRVEFNEQLTKEWFKKYIESTNEALMIVEGELTKLTKD